MRRGNFLGELYRYVMEENISRYFFIKMYWNYYIELEN